MTDITEKISMLTEALGGKAEMDKYMVFAFDHACEFAQEANMSTKDPRFKPMAESVRDFYIDCLWDDYQALRKKNPDKEVMITMHYKGKK